MQLCKCAELSQLAPATARHFSKKDVADLGEVQRGIEYSHNNEGFLGKQKEYRHFHVGKKMKGRI